jgi:hypothetical protein
MRRAKDGQRKALGVVGVSLSLAGVDCAEAGSAEAAIAPQSANVRPVDLHEVEMLDTTLGSFRLFDREDAKDMKPDVVAGGCRGCRSVLRKGCTAVWRGCWGRGTRCRCGTGCR